MSQMFLTNDEHTKFLAECAAKNPTGVTIASFGCYVGVTFTGADTTQWGRKYRLATRDLLESLRSNGNVRLLIGVGDYQSCRGNDRCISCEQKYVKALLRLVFQAELFPEFEWRLTTELHLKCVLFEYNGDIPRGVAGGRNFTDSSWADVTFALSQSQIVTLKAYVDHLWDNADPITDVSIESVMRTQRISSEVLQTLVSNEDKSCC